MAERMTRDEVVQEIKRMMADAGFACVYPEKDIGAIVLSFRPESWNTDAIAISISALEITNVHCLDCLVRERVERAIRIAAENGMRCDAKKVANG
jgi:hypothetical protein